MGRPTQTNALNRRSVLRNLAGAAAALCVLRSARSPAAELPHLDPKDPDAVAVGYVEDAGRVDAKKYLTFVKGSRCDNCLLLQGASGAGYRPCNLFAGKLVAAAGWCSGWTAEI